MNRNGPLLIGDIRSPYIVTMLKCLRDNGVDAAVLSIERAVILLQDGEEVPIEVSSTGRKRILQVLLKSISCLKSRSLRFSHAHFHYHRSINLFAYGMLRAAGVIDGRLTLSLWGSDLYRMKRWSLSRFTLNLLSFMAEKITVNSEDAVNVLCRQVRFRRDRIQVLRFPVGSLELIDFQRSTGAASFREELGVRSGQKVIICGSNGSKAQRHLKILEALSELPPRELDSFFILIPMTYGSSDEDYIESVQLAHSKMGVDGKVLRSYLSGDEIAELRLAGDVFIIGIETDMFSAAMQETLYAGNTVLAGSWLKYGFVSKLGLKISRFDSFDDLAGALQKVISNGNSDADNEQNIRIIGNIASPLQVGKKWAKLYRLKS